MLRTETIRQKGAVHSRTVRIDIRTFSLTLDSADTDAPTT